MIKYNIIEITCEKNAKISELIKEINKSVTSNRIIFEIHNLFKHEKDNISKKKKNFDSIGLQKFYYTFKPPGVRKESYDPNKHDSTIYSNLGDAWDLKNPNYTESLTKDQSNSLLNFFDSLKGHDASDIMYGLDEISWNGENPKPGTYGYKKALSLHHGGENYLSNSIIFSRSPWEGKPYRAFLCCESQFRNTNVVNKLIALLGKVKSEINLYSPETIEERKEWETENAIVLEKFEKFKAELPVLITKLPYEMNSYELNDRLSFNSKINVASIAKKILATDGWQKQTNYHYPVGTVFSKKKGDAELSVVVISQWGGRIVQIIASCISPKYRFSENIYYNHNLITEDDVIKYFKNFLVIRDHFYNMM